MRLRYQDTGLRQITVEGTTYERHAGAAVDSHSAHGVYKFFRLAFLMKA